MSYLGILNNSFLFKLILMIIDSMRSLTRADISKAFLNMVGNSRNVDYDHHLDRYYSAPSGQSSPLPHLTIANPKHLPPGCKVLDVPFKYTKWMYRFTITASIILGNKTSKKMRAQRSYQHREYELNRWFVINSLQNICSNHNISYVDLYDKIFNDITFKL